MNFLLRSTSTAAAEHKPTATPPRTASSVPPPSSNASKPPVTTLEGLIAEDKVLNTIEEQTSDISGFGSENGGMVAAMSAKDHILQTTDKHLDVKADEGWIAIPYKELPDNWKDALDIKWFHNFDRSFIFPGEQLNVLACLSASKKDTEIITPFKVAAITNKNDSGPESAHVNPEDRTDPMNGDGSHMDEYDRQAYFSASESLLRTEDHRRQTQTLLQRFNDSHFFVCITESGEPLWSSRFSPGTSETGDADGTENEKAEASINTVIDRGSFDARVSGGVARSSIKCCSLSNGDIVVLLQVNVGIDVLKDPMLEILQFETHDDRISSSQDVDTSTSNEHDSHNQESNADSDSFGELLKWMLPLDYSLPLTRPLSPPLASASHKASFSASSGSQLFSFSHFRSHSMSSINSGPPSTAAASPQSISSAFLKPSFDQLHWDQSASQKSMQSHKIGSEGLLSFRGVALEPDRFSVCCGLEGIYVPGRRWQRKLEMIQPIDIHTFSVDCNTDDLLTVQIKNVSPAHIPDLVVYIDDISIIFEEAPIGGPPLSVPVACTEAGIGYSLPNLALRRGEEHSFILKPATSLLKRSTAHGSGTTQQSRLKGGNKLSSIRPQPKATDEEQNVSSSDKYSIFVSCRCNYTESRLFFKKRTNWRPRISRELMISVDSEMSRQASEDDGRVSQLPVQVLTLQASNLTSEDLTLTVLAPASFTVPPSVVPFNSSPSIPVSPLVGFSTTQRLSSMPLLVENEKQIDNNGAEQEFKISDLITTTALACNHLWLQSRVPLGCIPSQSTATIKLGLLPLTDGIITLDTLQINVKEKGATYVPEQSLKINATRSIATAIV